MKKKLGTTEVHFGSTGPYKTTRPYTRQAQSRGLGRGSNGEGRGSGECRTHDSISHVQLGRSSDAKTARKTPKTPKKQRRDRPTDRQTDHPTDQHSDL